MRWTITRLKKFIKKGGEVRITGGESPPDNTTFIHRHQLRNYGHASEWADVKFINSTNIDAFAENYWAKWTITRVSPDYYTSTYYLNMKKYEEMKTDALDSKNAS